MPPAIEVRLTADLTGYHSSLVPGVEGHTCGHSNLGDRFVMVRFPGTTLDVLCKSLEIIDNEFLASIAEQERKMWERMAGATDVVKHVGPRGGFRGIGYHCKQGFYATDDRTEAIAWEAFFKKEGIPIREEVEK